MATSLSCVPHLHSPVDRRTLEGAFDPIDNDLVALLIVSRNRLVESDQNNVAPGSTKPPMPGIRTHRGFRRRHTQRERHSPRSGVDRPLDCGPYRAPIISGSNVFRWGISSGRFRRLRTSAIEFGQPLSHAGRQPEAPRRPGACSRGLTWEVSLGWYETILIEDPLLVTQARLVDQRVLASIIELEEDPGATL